MPPPQPIAMNVQISMLSWLRCKSASTYCCYKAGTHYCRNRDIRKTFEAGEGPFVKPSDEYSLFHRAICLSSLDSLHLIPKCIRDAILLLDFGQTPLLIQFNWDIRHRYMDMGFSHKLSSLRHILIQIVHHVIRELHQAG